MAEVYANAGTENTVILDVRQDVLTPFEAPNWTDLRCGWYLSLTQVVADETPAGLTADIANANSTSDRFWIGLKSNTQRFPTERGCVFIGWNNCPATVGTSHSKLVSSDIGIGAGIGVYWRPAATDPGGQNRGFFSMIDQTAPIIGYGDIYPHFPQNVVSAGGYSTLLLMRLTRPAVNSRIITAYTYRVNFSADAQYTSDPSDPNMRTALSNFPTNVHQIGPRQLTSVPDCFYCYWPFGNSRLKINCRGFMRRA